MIQVFFFSPAKHYYIMKIDDAIGEVQLSQCVLHKMFESCRDVTEAERHSGEFIEPQIPHGKSSILLGVWDHFYLSESTLEIHR